MKKIVVFTGAGISAESGVTTFRDSDDGLWYNYDVDKVATLKGWNDNPNEVNEFHNLLRSKLKDIKPNGAHKALAKLEKDFKVTIVTQNIDNLHELGGSKNVLHLHGEIYKSRSTVNPQLTYECLGDINEGDKCERGSKLRPSTVLFGEMPNNVEESYRALYKCDYLLIIGTSLSIGYTIPMLKAVNSEAKIYYIDPDPSPEFEEFYIPVKYIKENAVKGVKKVIAQIKKENKAN